MKWKFAVLGIGPLLILAVAGHRWQRDQVDELRAEVAKLKQLEREREQSAEAVARTSPSPFLAHVVDPVSLRDRNRSRNRPDPEGAASDAPAAADPSPDVVARWNDEHRSSLASVEAAFTGESVDARWSADASRGLNNHLRAQLPNSASLGGLECRSSICRIEVAYRDADAWNQFNDTAFTAPNANDRVWDGPMMSLPPEQKADGSFDVVMYLGREGTSLLHRQE